VDKLLIISDFDHTLSRHSLNGKPCGTTHGALAQAMKNVDINFYNQSEVLCEKYMPIEFCASMSIEEKIPHMVDWWEESHKLTVQSRFGKHELEDFTAKSNIVLRDRVSDFVAEVDRQRVPLILFSAGVGNIIEFVLKQQLKAMPKSIHLISNQMNFGENGICVGFREPIIHTFNKNSSVIRHEEPSFFQRIANRSYIILIGDSIGDVHMDVGVASESVALRIGFLNRDHAGLMEKYMQAYDMVLVDDQTFDVPLLIFNQIKRATEEVE